MYIFFNVYACDYFTCYSKQINNYNVTLLALACECVCLVVFLGIFVFVFFVLKARPPFRFLPNRRGPKTGSLLVCVWSVLVLFQHNLFVGKLVPFNCSCRTILFLLVSSFSNKDWTLKLLHCIVFHLSVIRVCLFFLPFHKYIIVKKLETLIPLTYMYDNKVAY